METVFADQTTISAPFLVDTFLKPKRSAFILITAESEISSVALNELRKIAGVEAVYLSRGAYDIVAKVNGNSLEYIRECVLKQITTLESVKSTLTLSVI